MPWYSKGAAVAAGFLLAALSAGCPSPTVSKRAEAEEKEGYYASPYVRRCLQYEKEKMVSQSQACWEELLARIERDPEFGEKAKLAPADIEKIRHSARSSGDRSRSLAKEQQACLRVADRPRSARIACLEDFLARHENELSISQRYEVESAIASLKEAEDRATGKQEATIERAGILLGMSLVNEEQGVRIEKVLGVPATQAELQEQGLVLQISGAGCPDLEAAERISRLESCEQAPIRLLVRYGEMDPVEFLEAELSCGHPPAGKLLRRVTLSAENCSEEKDAETALGLSWCYLAAEGVLEVEQVCANSPAARSGLRPGQRIDRIGVETILGKTPVEIARLLQAFPAQSLAFHTQGEALDKPLPISGPALDATSRAACWRAILSAREEASIP